MQFFSRQVFSNAQMQRKTFIFDGSKNVGTSVWLFWPATRVKSTFSYQLRLIKLHVVISMARSTS